MILLEGPFESAFLEGSNKSILPTETQKNTIYALAKMYPVEPIEVLKSDDHLIDI